MVKKFTITWKKSTQPRKQRSYRYNAPLHVKQKFVHVHLSSELRNKHGARNVQVRKGDRVKVLRGTFRKTSGKVERVSLKYEKIYVTGVETPRKNGSKVLVPLNPSNLMITELDLSNKKRKIKLSTKATPVVKEAVEVKESK